MILCPVLQALSCVGSWALLQCCSAARQTGTWGTWPPPNASVVLVSNTANNWNVSLSTLVDRTSPSVWVPHTHSRFHNCKCTQMFNCCLKTDLYQSFSFSSAYSLLHHSAPPRTNFINSLIQTLDCMLYQDLWIDGHCNENEHFLQLMQPYRHPAKIKLVIRKLSSVSNVSTSGKVWTYSACMSMTPIKHFKYLS